MITTIRDIGNSKGIILPKYFIENCHIGKEVEIDIKDGTIIITPIQSPRQDWADRFQLAVQSGELERDEMIDDTENEFDQTEWTW
jgi:antitoxin MazE